VIPIHQEQESQAVTFATSRSDTTQPKIRAVILDYGEVLCHPPTPEAIDRMARIFQMDSARFFPTYLQSRVPYDKGDLLPDEYWQKFAEQAGVRIDAATIENLRRWDLELWSTLNDAMILWVQKIHAAGYKTAILSNMPSDMVVHVRKNFAWLKHFDHHVFSADLRSVKPEPKIYQHCIAALGVQPAEALFVDDREINLEQARATGIRTIRFQSLEQFREDLQTLGFPILPASAA
jgi:putative hydrolase of the HAD superfamily